MTFENVKSYLKRINPRSPIFIAGVFSIVLLLLIALTVRSHVADQQNINTIAHLTPTPKDTFVPKSEVVSGQILVKFKPGVSDFVINQHLASYSASIKSRISGINTTVVQVPVGKEESVRQGLSKDPIVQYAEPDHVAHGVFVPNDTNFPNQYGLNNTGQEIKGNTGKPNADIHIEEAWDVTKGNGFTVAILDTGLDMSHPEFGGKVTSQKVFITDSIDDGYGHGTHTAGILSADTNNGAGIAGACPDCKLMVGKVLDNSGNGPYSVIAQGITWAADSGAKVISMSLGGYDDDQTLKQATDYAWSKGSVIVAAAGNDNTTNKFYPGGDPHVVTVAATDNNDVKASFSNYGDWVMVAAPGKDIFSTVPTHSYALQSRGLANNYDYLSGTSMATPMVAGVVALLWTTPYGTSNQAVVDRLYSTVDPISGTGTYWQKGRINAAAAVASSVSPSPSLSPTTSVSPSVAPTSSITPFPTFVCGGSPNSICNPTTTVSPKPTNGVNPTITEEPNITSEPNISPSVTPVPDQNPCLNPREPGFVQKILDWVGSLRQQLNDFINSLTGNPNTPAPKITPPCIQQ